MKVDFHNHFYPPQYLAELEKGDTRAKVERDEHGQLLLFYAGDYNVIVRTHRDAEERIREMERCGVDMQVLTLTTPGVHIEEPKQGVALARVVNDAFAAMMEKHRQHFMALAALPLQDPEAATAELERAVTELGLPGAVLFTNVNGQPLDAPHYRPLYEKAAALDALLFIHPTSPVGVEAMEDYRLVPLVGFPLDTTLAISRLVFSGLLETFPDLKFVLAHLGGAVPYLAERIDRGYFAYQESRANISKPPSEYFKKVYMDTVSFDPAALQFALAFAGPEKLLLGSDYPHQIGDLQRSVRVIEGLPILAEDRERILGRNAVELLKLEV
ncbi:MAG: amidohydrolase family protein [Anaerolineae bacterium]